MLFMARGCGDDNRPRITDETIPPETTTTTEPPQPPYWQKFGWSGPEDLWAAQEAIDSGSMALVFAAGRCTVTLTTQQSAPESQVYEVVKNPLITTGSAGGHAFTVFAGYQAFTEESGESGSLIPRVPIIDGELQWGSVGLIPGQTELVDTAGPLEVNAEPRFDQLLDATYFPPNTQNSYYSNAPLQNGIVPAEVVILPKAEAWRVLEHCDVPSLRSAQPPVSRT